MILFPGLLWRSFGRALGLKGRHLDKIEHDYGKYGTEEMVCWVIEKWCMKTYKPDKEHLKAALIKAGYNADGR